MTVAAGLNRTRIVLAAMLVSGAIGAQEAPPMSNGTWIRVWDRFGLQVERNTGADQWRVVGPGGKTIASGTLEDCLPALGEELAKPDEDAIEGPWNMPLPTFGGMQFWGDEFFDRGWKIQQSAITGHCRLIDPGRVRRAWGSYEQCKTEYDRLRAKAGGIKADDQSIKLVILLHGIFRTSESFSKLRKRLAAMGYETCGMNYASTRAGIEVHAAQLNRLLDRLENVESIHVVCHSMGGLVIRAALKERPDPRIRGIVTMGTPHHGAIQATMLADWFPYKVLFGPAGQQLVRGAETFAAGLPVPPPVPIACIAGGKGNGKGFSPVIAGDDDGTVGIDSALPAFAADTLVVNVSHSFITRNNDAIEATCRFINTGSFGDLSGKTPR